MSTKRVVIQSEGTIVGRLREGSRQGGVVVCHPHPLYGGNMDNNVVQSIEEGFSSNGFTTLTFNFRGVGGSAGSYDEGDGEVTDALAALSFLREGLDEPARVVLAGYSFGAWIAVKAAKKDPGLSALFLVSYPFAFYPSDLFKGIAVPVYFIGGTSDDIGPVDDLLRVYGEITLSEKNLKIISTDHFYHGKEREIADFIKEQIPL